MRQSSYHKTETIKRDPLSHIFPKIIPQTITTTTTIKQRLKPPHTFLHHTDMVWRRIRNPQQTSTTFVFSTYKRTTLETPKQKLKT